MSHYLLEQQQEQYRVAKEIAIDAKAIKVCDFGHMAYGIWDVGEAERLSRACAIANARWTSGKIEPGLFASRLEMTDKIKSVIAEHSSPCCTYPDCPNG